MSEPAGGKLLDGYLEKHGISRGDAASDLNVSRVTLWKWIEGHGTPLAPARVDIRIYTRGAVPEDSWGPHMDKRGAA